MANSIDQPPDVPSREEIASLPKWAIVAFAARCARRVQPLFQYFWPDAPDELILSIDRASKLAQASSENPAMASTARSAIYLTAASKANAAASAVETALGSATVETRNAAADAAYAARNAAFAVLTAAESLKQSSYVYAAKNAVDSAVYAVQNAAEASAELDARIQTSLAIRHDLQTLIAAAINNKWSDSTAVPSDFFGPLWPEGTPAAWPQYTSKNTPVSLHDLIEESSLDLGIVDDEGLSIEFEIPDDIDDDFLAALIAALITATSARHVEHGGSGLQLKGLLVESASFVREGGSK